MTAGKKSPEAEWLEKGDSLFEAYRYEEALEAYRKVRAVDPGYLHAVNRMGTILTLTG
ncbi:MAG: hypothetical protein GKC05_08190, partial [Methanomicrobiales archaeon]|nr:hypothetical protein [Methanomicrobiales archaeon]